MTKRKRIILIIVVLLIGLGFVSYLVFFDDKFKCEMEYRSCLKLGRRGHNISCKVCDFYNINQ